MVQWASKTKSTSAFASRFWEHDIPHPFERKWIKQSIVHPQARLNQIQDEKHQWLNPSISDGAQCLMRSCPANWCRLHDLLGNATLKIQGHIKHRISKNYKPFCHTCHMSHTISQVSWYKHIQTCKICDMYLHMAHRHASDSTWKLSFTLACGIAQASMETMIVELLCTGKKLRPWQQESC